MEERQKGNVSIAATIIILTVIGIGFYYYFSVVKPNNEDSTYQSVVPGESQAIKDIYIHLQDFLKTLPLELETALHKKPILRDLAQNENGDRTLTTILDYQFETPWGKGFEIKNSDRTDGFTQIFYKNEKNLLMSCTRITPYQTLLRVFSDSEIQSIMDVFPEELNSSRYAFTDLLLSTTPDRVRKSLFPDQAEALSKIIVIKSVFLPSTNQPYQFKSEHARGFQFGDYTKEQDIHLMIFPDNNTRCEILGRRSDDINQTDINIILSTFRPL